MMRAGIVIAADNRVMFADEDGNWSFSSRLPGVYKVDQVQWIYGDALLAIVEKTDGKHAIMVCSQYGKGTWLETFTTGKQIFSFDRIAPGWALISTETGYYQTVDAGRTITLLNSDYKDHRAICVMGQVVIAHNGKTKLLRSSNGGSTFSTAYTIPAYPTRPTTATVAGTPYRLLAGFGENVYESVDDGVTWSEKFSLTGENVIQIINLDDSETPDFLIKTFQDVTQFDVPGWITYRIDHSDPDTWTPIYWQQVIAGKDTPKMHAISVKNTGEATHTTRISDVQSEAINGAGISGVIRTSFDAHDWVVAWGENH